MLNLSLTIEQVELILGILAKAPYETSAGIIEEIRNQAIPQLPPQEAPVEKR
jgi:hypothetical protein